MAGQLGKLGLEAPAGRDRRAWVRARVEELLSDPKLPDPRNGPVDDRWEWVAPLLLDAELAPFLRAWRDGRLRRFDDEPLPRPNPEFFGAYVDDMLAVEPGKLGRRPPDLAGLLTDLALGSPAILASRCLRAVTGIGDDTRRRLAVTIADAFWSLFNQPAVISLIRQLGGGDAPSEPSGGWTRRLVARVRQMGAGERASRDESPYWRLVLQYCRHGNLQAVLDEQWHLLWEQDAWAEDASAEGDRRQDAPASSSRSYTRRGRASMRTSSTLDEV